MQREEPLHVNPKGKTIKLLQRFQVQVILDGLNRRLQNFVLNVSFCQKLDHNVKCLTKKLKLLTKLCVYLRHDKKLDPDHFNQIETIDVIQKQLSKLIRQ